MKRILLLTTTMNFCFISYAQYIYKIKADSVLLSNDSCRTELIIENSTKNVQGFLYNRVNGRTEFKKSLQKVNDSVYISGADTLRLSIPTDRFIKNQYATQQVANARVSGRISAKMIESEGIGSYLYNNNGNGYYGTFYVGDVSGWVLTQQGNNILSAGNGPIPGVRLMKNLYARNDLTGKQIMIGSPDGDYTGIWMGQTTPAYNNYTMANIGGTYINSPSGDLHLVSGGYTDQHVHIFTGGNMALKQPHSYTTTYALDVNGGHNTEGTILRSNHDSPTATIIALTIESRVNVSNSSNGYGVGQLFKAENGNGNSASAGSIEFSYSDVTAGSEDADFILKAANSGTLTERFRVTSEGKPVFSATNTASGTTGAQTIHKTSGTVNIAASAATVVVTNNLVTTSSIVFAVIRSNDATAQVKNVVPASGSFTINLSSAATSETSIGFLVIN